MAEFDLLQPRQPNALGATSSFDALGNVSAPPINLTGIDPSYGLNTRDNSLISPSSIPGGPDNSGTGVSWFGGNGTVSGLDTGLGLGKGLMDAYLGFEQLGAAKDALNFKKEAFNKQFGAQTQSFNTQLQDRQAARVSADPSGHQSVEDYMARNAL